MTCSSATDAPWNDLKLIQCLLKYEAVNQIVSNSAVRAFRRHLWYLTTEMVRLALFSTKVPADERRALASSLLAIKPDEKLLAPQNRFGMGFGKPKFPDDISATTTLAQLVGPDSWYTFHLLQLDDSFLTEPVEKWPDHPAFQTSAAHILAINVINDCKERGVKLSADFTASAKSEEHYQNVLQVVEQDRNMKSNLRKQIRTTVSLNWTQM
ncbi:hypothetical protein GWK47_031683 [Chionoecetes opilio]|uniref:Uncharacterized protein n=1 Tax=Chionoecetes opilio TaxID=41210 RepID=A0A8J4Z0T7_CHIOP|nr:hypothetical protein GWK47_031683 [Chionoecetes opilio]